MSHHLSEPKPPAPNVWRVDYQGVEPFLMHGNYCVCSLRGRTGEKMFATLEALPEVIGMLRRIVAESDGGWYHESQTGAEARAILQRYEGVTA